MKALSAILLATTFSPLLASAQVGDSDEWRVPEFEYISWCNQNAVMTNDDQGREKVLADCSASGLTCELEKTMIGGRPAIHALCR